MDDVLRFDGGLPHDETIDIWLADRPDDLRPLAQRWFVRMRECGDDVLELMHDGNATVCVGDAAFAYVGVYTKHVNVGFFNGAALPDPAGLLEGTGKRGRHVKLRPGQDVDAAALAALIDDAYADIKARLAD